MEARAVTQLSARMSRLSAAGVGAVVQFPTLLQEAVEAVVWVVLARSALRQVAQAEFQRRQLTAFPAKASQAAWLCPPPPTGMKAVEAVRAPLLHLWPVRPAAVRYAVVVVAVQVVRTARLLRTSQVEQAASLAVTVLAAVEQLAQTARRPPQAVRAPMGTRRTAAWEAAVEARRSQRLLAVLRVVLAATVAAQGVEAAQA